MSPAYLRFLERFPTAGHLAAASPADALAAWQGLTHTAPSGYPRFRP